MRNKLLCLLGLLAGSAAAQDGKTYRVNTIEGNNEELIRDAYRYPQFIAGAVHFKDGTATQARLNYHRLYDQVLFISPKGDTLALAVPDAYKFIAIGKDTFYVHGNGYLERITHYKGVNLARKSAFVVDGREKKGGYGTYSATTAVESRSHIVDRDGRVLPLKVDENTLFRAKNLYFLSDAYHSFSPATKKNFYNLFSKQEQKLKAYLDAHRVNFSRPEDLLPLLAYMQDDKE
jgi:hypothetical protein